MKNSTNKSDAWQLPSTLEDFQKEVERQHSQSAGSLTSETQKVGQPEATKTYEISFVPVPPKQSQPVQPVDNLIEEFNKKAEQRGMLAPKPPEGLQVILHHTSPRQPQQAPPENTPEQSTKKYSNLVDTTSQYLGGAIQITNYPHPRKPQSSEIPVKK